MATAGVWWLVFARATMRGVHARPTLRQPADPSHPDRAVRRLPGREAEYFGLYEISERGTSWLGTFALGLAVQTTGSYRSGILVLLVFFVSGGVLLALTDMRRAILAAGNELPDKV